MDCPRSRLAGGFALDALAAFFSPPLDLTVYTDMVDYEFKDEEYAAEFAALNNPRIEADDDSGQSFTEEV